jgi:hypothetical protein
MARSLTTLSAQVCIALALAASTGAFGCIGEVTDEDDAELNGETPSDDLSCDQEGVTQQCMTNPSVGFEDGVQYCIMNENQELTWGDCVQSTVSTPLVLSFDSAPVTFNASAGSFDLTGTMSIVTDWPAATTPWLALDRNGNGTIDDGGELFGSATVLNQGGRAENGFQALAELDSNHDGRITADDAAFSSLVLWADHDGDRASSAGELSSAVSSRLVSIELGYSRDRRCDARGNCEIERASFRYITASGEERTGTVVDVHLKHQ